MIILSVTIVILNTACLLITTTSSKLRSNPSSVLLISLLSLHLFQGCVVIPCQIGELHMSNHILSVLSQALFTTANCGICIHVLTIAIDRLLAVKLLASYKNQVTKKRMTISIIFVWVYIIITSSIPFLTNGNTALIYHETSTWRYYIIIINMVFPSAAIIVIYTMVFQTMKEKYKVNPLQDSIKSKTNLNTISSPFEVPSTLLVSPQHVMTPPPSTSDSPKIMAIVSALKQRNETDNGKLSAPSQFCDHRLKSIVNRFKSNKKVEDKVIKKSIKTTFKIMLSYIVMWVPCITYKLINTATGLKHSGNTKSLTEIIIYTVAFLDSIVCPVVYCYYNYAFKSEYKKLKRRKTGKSQHINLTIMTPVLPSRTLQQGQSKF